MDFKYNFEIGYINIKCKKIFTGDTKTAFGVVLQSGASLELPFLTSLTALFRKWEM